MKCESSHRTFLNIHNVYILYTSIPSHWIPGDRTRRETQASCPVVQFVFKVFWTVMDHKTKKHHRSSSAQYLFLSKYRLGSLGDKQNKGKIMSAGRPSFFFISTSFWFSSCLHSSGRSQERSSKWTLISRYRPLDRADSNQPSFVFSGRAREENSLPRKL